MRCSVSISTTRHRSPFKGIIVLEVPPTYSAVDVLPGPITAIVNEYRRSPRHHMVRMLTGDGEV
jgi:heat shock protein HspQ